MPQSSWVKYRDMGGPRFRGTVVYNPPKPWDVWSQILGVVARCEGKFDTVVMYDETGVTFGFLQWTMKSGRLQNFLEYLKSVPADDGSSNSVFDEVCLDDSGTQVFYPFQFIIKNGKFCYYTGNRDPISGQSQYRELDPNVDMDRRLIVDVCMGRASLLTTKEQQKFALDLCDLFVRIGQDTRVQRAQIEFAKSEFTRSLDYTRPPLAPYGLKTIRDLLPEGSWGSPIPAIFFNLFQNSPAGAFKLFSNALGIAAKKGLVGKVDSGYEMSPTGLGVFELLDVIWRRLCQTAYADWGFKSAQYLQSGKKNPPRIKNIQPAIVEFYKMDLPFYGE